MSRNQRGTLVVGATVGIIAVGAVVAVLVWGTRSPVTLDPSTPQGTVQAFVRSALDGHSEEAVAHLASDSPCGTRDLDQVDVDSSARVVLLDTRTEGDRAWVDVRVTITAEGAPLGADQFREDHTYRLLRSGGGWVVLGTPWPLYACQGGTS